MLQIIVNDTVAFLIQLDLAIFCYRGFDDEMRAVVARNLEARGIDLHPRTTLTQVLQLVGILVDLLFVAIISCFCSYTV